jgi:CheY-like chemotaxis protein
MFQKEWEILLVDDEPDVLAVSALAMRSIRIYGVPLKLHTCRSKAEALELINRKADLLPALAVAVIDVVMETDTAGLELCRFIREERNNPLTQLFIRTGQPGTAPERDVIDRYDINGYFTKVEATEDKLYSMIKSGVRQYYWSAYALGVLTNMRQVSNAIGSRAAIARTLQQSLEAAFQERSGEAVASYANVNCAYIFGDQVAASVGWDDAGALAARDRLTRLDGVALRDSGETYVIGENHELLVKVPGRDGSSDAFIVATPSFRVPEFVPAVMHSALASHAACWHHSR